MASVVDGEAQKRHAHEMNELGASSRPSLKRVKVEVRVAEEEEEEDDGDYEEEVEVEEEVKCLDRYRETDFFDFKCKKKRSMLVGRKVAYETGQFDFKSDKRRGKIGGKAALYEEGQVWAMYDEYGMPRRYVRINKDRFYGDNIEIHYLNVGYTRAYMYKASGALHACGDFKPFGKVSVVDPLSLSNKLPRQDLVIEDRWDKRRNIIQIYPRKGEIWAISKDPDLNCTPIDLLGSPHMQKYQIVEVLEDYCMKNGTKVVYLVKVKGFYKSSFRRYEINRTEVSFGIDAKDLDRFSHYVPSFRITGDTHVSDCVELDPSSLPHKIDDFTEHEVMNIKEENLYQGYIDLKAHRRQVDFTSCRRCNNLYAVFDSQSGMPIKYAKIGYCESDEEFPIRVTWLEPDPITANEKRWCEAGSPIACGSFRQNKITHTQGYPMLSHWVPMPNVRIEQFEPSGEIYNIYPRKGDVWGIYKDWDMGWSADPSRVRGEFEYEIVEIAGRYSRENGVRVVRLAKVEGFKGLFIRKNNNGVEVSMRISRNELYKFSHQIFAYRIQADLDGGIPKGSFVLDPLLLSTINPRENFMLEASTHSEKSKKDTIEERNWDETNNGIELENQENTNKTPELISNDSMASAAAAQGHSEEDIGEKLLEREEISKQKVIGVTNELSVRECGEGSKIVAGDAVEKAREVPIRVNGGVSEPQNREFCDFHDYNLSKDFELEQIWALHDERDGMPRSYAQINKLVPADLNVEVILLEPHPISIEEMQWVEENLPMACGTFRTTKSTMVKSISVFSHKVTCKVWKSVKSFYKIFPRKGEIWAIYKNWDINWTHPDLRNNSQYTMVEVTSDFTEEAGVLVAGLIRVEGTSAVFQGHLHEGFGLFQQFLGKEMLRFSHSVPAVQLGADNSNGIPQGSWKLDCSIEHLQL